MSLFFLPASHRSSFLFLTRVPIETPVDHLESFLREFPNAPVDIFHDTPDQTLKVEKVPPNLYGLDPYRWIRHKKKSFEEEAVFSGMRQYRGKNREILLASVQISSYLVPWLEQLQTFPNPIQNIYAFALEQVYAYRQLHQSLSSRPSKWLLGVNLEEDGRMRHTILHEDRFVLSRLLPPMTHLLRLSDAENMTREIQGTLRYLMKQFPVHAAEIEGIFLGTGIQADFLKEVFESKYWILSPQEGATLLDVSPSSPDFDTLFLAWFYKHERRSFLSFKPVSKEQKGIHWPFQKSGWILGLAFGLSLWIGACIFFLQTQQLEKDIILLEEKDVLFKEEASDLDPLLEAFPLSADQFRQVISIQEDLNSSSENPLNVLDRLKNVLGENLRLRQLDWQGELAEGFSNTLTLEAYPVSTMLSQKELVFLFDGFLAKLKEEFPKSTLEILHGPYSTHQTQLLTGGLQDEELSPDPVCIVKITW